MLILELFIILCLLSAAYAGWRAAPWWPTHRADLDRVLRLASIQPGQTVYDLGCGDGRLLVEIARCTKAQKVIGFELSLIFYLISRLRLLPYRHAQVYFQDFWKADLRDADLVYFFLTHRIHQRLRQKLERELKPGAKVMCYTWPMDGWTPLSIDRLTGRSLYLYQVPQTSLRRV